MIRDRESASTCYDSRTYVKVQKIDLKTCFYCQFKRLLYILFAEIKPKHVHTLGLTKSLKVNPHVNQIWYSPVNSQVSFT